MIYKRLFTKIKILSDMAFDIGNFVESQGVLNFVERMDLGCGAIPPGEYEQIIDQSAPEVFLQLYLHIAERRFAFAVTEAVKIHPGFLEPIKKYCFDCGKSFKPAKVATVQSAYDLINAFVLDGMPEDETRKLTVVEPNKIIWEKVKDTHKEFWEKAGGDIELYYELQTLFIQGLLEGSGIEFVNDGNSVFSLIISISNFHDCR